jgi:hypothetical protein
MQAERAGTVGPPANQRRRTCPTCPVAATCGRRRSCSPPLTLLNHGANGLSRAANRVSQESLCGRDGGKALVSPVCHYLFVDRPLTVPRTAERAAAPRFPVREAASGWWGMRAQPPPSASTVAWPAHEDAASTREIGGNTWVFAISWRYGNAKVHPFPRGTARRRIVVGYRGAGVRPSRQILSDRSPARCLGTIHATRIGKPNVHRFRIRPGAGSRFHLERRTARNFGRESVHRQRASGGIPVDR